MYRGGGVYSRLKAENRAKSSLWRPRSAPQPRQLRVELRGGFAGECIGMPGGGNVDPVLWPKVRPPHFLLKSWRNDTIRAGEDEHRRCRAARSIHQRIQFWGDLRRQRTGKN